MNTGRCLPINSARVPWKFSSGFAVPYFFLLAVLCSAGQSSGLRLTSMKVPVVADVREDMEIECHFDMGVEELYAVKWYKDEKEFFRFIPSQDPNKMLFAVDGVQLDPFGTNCTYGHCKLRLQNLTRHHSNGEYKCEISSEAPAFRLASETHNVTVAALPKENPKIEGLTTSYTEGDIVRAKCISDLADPTPVLSWYINGHSIPEISKSDSNKPFLSSGLSLRTSSIRVLLDSRFFQGENLNIRCEAALPGVSLAPMVATHTVLVRRYGDPLVSNHWHMDLLNRGSQTERSLHIAWMVVVATAIHSSIGRFLK